MDRQAKHLLEFGPFRMDLEERVLMRDQEAITLSRKAFETLLALVQDSERVEGLTFSPDGNHIYRKLSKSLRPRCRCSE